MKLLFLLLALFLSNLIFGQDKDTTSLTVTCTQAKGKIVCKHLTGSKFSSCEYFYPDPSAELKAKGRKNLSHQKIGKWTYYHQNGKQSGIAFFTKNGEKKGTWKYYNSMSGRVCEVIQIKKGKFGLMKPSNKSISLENIVEPSGDFK